MNPALHLLGGRAACLLGSAVIAAGLDDGDRPVLVDRHEWSAGADVVLGIDHLPGVRWGDLAEADGRLDPAGLARRLPTGPDGRCALACAQSGAQPVSEAVTAAGLAAVRAGFDLVVTLGRSPVPAPYAPGDLVCVVTDSDLLALTTAVAVTRWLRERAIRHHTVVVGGRPDRHLVDDLPDRVHRLMLRRGDLRDLNRGRLCRGRGLRSVARSLLAELPEGGVAA